jgi:hypothetical protein
LGFFFLLFGDGYGYELSSIHPAGRYVHTSQAGWLESFVSLKHYNTIKRHFIILSPPLCSFFFALTSTVPFVSNQPTSLI